MIPANESSQENKEIQPEGQLVPMAKWMLVGLTVFFFLASLAQLAYLHKQIAKTPDLNLMVLVSERIKRASPEQDLLPLMELESRVALEEYALKRRHHQGNVLLMSRIWISYLSFVTGMILSLVGASFILSRIREPVTKLDADSKVVKFSIASSSPGIILASLGTLLIMTSILTNHRIAVKDQSVYLHAYRYNPAFQQAIPSCQVSRGCTMIF
jgi:hypothetical protein